jgi:hypothetical protein
MLSIAEERKFSTATVRPKEELSASSDSVGNSQALDAFYKVTNPTIMA